VSAALREEQTYNLFAMRWQRQRHVHACTYTRVSCEYCAAGRAETYPHVTRCLQFCGRYVPCHVYSFALALNSEIAQPVFQTNVAPVCNELPTLSSPGTSIRTYILVSFGAELALAWEHILIANIRRPPFELVHLCYTRRRCESALQP
jgi:hypothetical protein